MDEDLLVLWERPIIISLHGQGGVVLLSEYSRAGRRTCIQMRHEKERNMYRYTQHTVCSTRTPMLGHQTHLMSVQIDMLTQNVGARKKWRGEVQAVRWQSMQLDVQIQL